MLMLLPKTQEIGLHLKKSPDHSWTTLCIKTIDCVHQAGPRKCSITQCSMYPPAWCLPSLSLGRSLCQNGSCSY